MTKLYCDVCGEVIENCSKCEEPFSDGDSLNCGGFNDGDHICSVCIGSEGSVTSEKQ